MSFLSYLFPQNTLNSTPAPEAVVAPDITAADPVQPPAASPNIFSAAFKILLSYEGGYGADPRDSGNWTSGKCGVGECLGTNYGVDTASYAGTVAKMPPALRASLPAAVRDLTVDQAGQIYKSRYWDVCRCDELPAPLALVVFDGAVNSGPGRSIQWLQGAVGAAVDGGFGPNTLAAVNVAVATHGAVSVAAAILNTRLSFLEGLPTFEVYGRGWTNRVNDLRARIGSFPA
jgi:lysozyme family protein